MDWILPLRKACKSIFPIAEYAWTSIPTYPSGAMGFMVCGKSASTDLRKPARTWSTEEEDKHFKYYSKEVHEAAFKLPKFAEKALR
jgi:spermidine synthase